MSLARVCTIFFVFMLPQAMAQFVVEDGFAPNTASPPTEPVAEPATTSPTAESTSTSAESTPSSAVEPTPQTSPELMVPPPVPAMAPAALAPVASATAPTTANPAVSSLQVDPKQQFLTREKQIQDSLVAIESVTKSLCDIITATLPPLKEKDEFETTDAFAKRKTAWDKVRADKCAAEMAPLQKKLADLNQSLAQLRKDVKKHQGTLELTSTPAGALIVLNGKEVGKTPMNIGDLWAGIHPLKLTLEGYQDFIATPVIKAKDETELHAKMLEKSIFTQINEINLSALLAKDTPEVRVYQERIARIRARIAEVDGEFAEMMKGIKLKNPLAPKNEFESTAMYQEREVKWKKTVDSLSKSIQGKHSEYRNRLLRAIEVLQDYTIVQAKEPKIFSVPNTAMTLESYNADQNQHGIVVEQTTEGHPFRFEGIMKISPEDARAANKQSTGFDLKARYYDIPVQFNNAWIYPAWHSLDISKAGKVFPTEGVFKLPGTWKADSTVNAAIMRADSLRKGLIEAKNLGLEYALESEVSSGTRVWMIVLRGVLLSAGAAGLTYGYLQEREASRLSDNYNPANLQQAETQLQEIRDTETRRNQSYFAGSVFTLCGLISFAF